MSGSSYDRRKQRRAAQRNGTAKRKAIDLGDGVWVSPKLKEVLDNIPPLTAPPLPSGENPPKDVSPHPSLDLVEPEPRGEAEWVAYLERSLLNDTMWARSKDPIWIQAFEEHGVYGKPSGCARCYGKVLQWYKAGKPERKPYVHEVESEQSFEERKRVHRDQTDAVAERLLEEPSPFLRNLEKRSWLWRLWNFVKRIWQ